MSDRKLSRVNVIAIAFCTLSSGFWMVFAAQKYYYFSYVGGWDLAFQSQILWGALHGNFSPSVLESNFLTIHCQFFLCLVAPFYWLFPEPVLLQYVKIGFFYCGTYLFFLILKKRLHPAVALGAMMAYSLAPTNIGMLSSLFNIEPLAIPFIFLIFKSLDEQKYFLYIISCILLMTIKEHMPILVMMFGLLAFFAVKKDRVRWVVVPILMGLTIFILEVFVMVPYLRQGLPTTQSYFWGRYAQFGDTPAKILLFLVTHPGAILTKVFSAPNGRWYYELFGLWGALAFLSPHILGVALPLFIKTFLSNFKLEHEVIHLYYGSIFACFIFLAAWNTLNRINNKWRVWTHSLVIVLMLIQTMSYLPQWKWGFDAYAMDRALIMRRLIDQIPPDSRVFCTDSQLPYLANRRELYRLADYMIGNPFKRQRPWKPVDGDYVLLDFRDFRNAKPRAKTIDFIFDERWTLKESIDDAALFIFHDDHRPAPRLIERGDHPFLPAPSPQPVNFDNVLLLEGMSFPQELPQDERVFPVTMYWKCLRSTQVSYEIEFSVSREHKTVYEKRRRLCFNFYPTQSWHKGEYIKETYFYLLPHLRPEVEAIEIKLYNPRTHQWLGGYNILTGKDQHSINRYFAIPR